MLLLMRQAAIAEAPTQVAESVEPEDEIDEDMLLPARLRLATRGREEREAHRDWNGETSAGTADAQYHQPQKTVDPAPVANQRFGQHRVFGKRR